MGQGIFYFRTVIGGKEYEGGNTVCLLARKIIIEFDSDYCIASQPFNGKNWIKRAKQVVKKIPDPVTVDWFVRNGWSVPKEILKLVEDAS